MKQSDYIRSWFQKRGGRFVWQRATSLLNRYGVTEKKAARRTLQLMETLAQAGCAPTFPTPGIVVERHHDFLKRLQSAGAEIAVHSFQHLELTRLPIADAVQQLEKAAAVFQRYGIEYRGFRCPYIDCSEELLDAVPEGLFEYSSNLAIQWDDRLYAGAAGEDSFYRRLHVLYRGREACDAVSVPITRKNLIEIPVTLPDDLLLHDGLALGPDGIERAWILMLDTIYRRGELFTVLFHPELADYCVNPFAGLLAHVTSQRPGIWVTRLRDISAWWKEKSRFHLRIEEQGERLCLTFACSPRATILARGLSVRSSPWDETYRRVEGNQAEVPARPRPFVGLVGSAALQVADLLREQGYLVETGEKARECGITLDDGILGRLCGAVEIIDYIERSQAPLIRFGRWPDGNKCALSITGDLDALTLVDYASRFIRFN